MKQETGFIVTETLDSGRSRMRDRLGIRDRKYSEKLGTRKVRETGIGSYGETGIGSAKDMDRHVVRSRDREAERGSNRNPTYSGEKTGSDR